MTPPQADVVLAALAALGQPGAVVEAGAVVARNERAGALGSDLAGLARSAAEAPVLVDGADGVRYEVRAAAVGAALVVVGRDVTEREALRRDLDRSDEILAIGSHELKGPLHVIGMICHLLETRAG